MYAFSQAWNSFFLKENSEPINTIIDRTREYGNVPSSTKFSSRNQASIRDPKLVTQEKFDENKPTLDTSTPPNPFEKAWNFLKADPEMQIQGRGTAPPSIRGMMGRRHQAFNPEQMTPQPPDAEGRGHSHEDYSGVDTPPWLTHQREEPQGEEMSDRPMTDVSRPVAPWREHTETMPEESFLTPSERWQAQEGLGANLRRNVGGQQSGKFMGPLRHKLDVQQGVSRGMRLKPHVRQFEEKEPAQTDDQQLDAMLAEMAAMSGGELSHTPTELPDPEPKEQPDLRGGVGAIARRAAMDEPAAGREESMVESQQPAWEHEANPKYSPDWGVTAGGQPKGFVIPSGEHGKFKRGFAHETSMGVDPRQEQAMGATDPSEMEQMDFGDDQPMMGQQGLRERLFQIANQKAREKHRAPEPAAPETPPEIQAMQSEIDRRL